MLKVGGAQMWKHWWQYLQPNLAKQDTEFTLLRHLFSLLLLETYAEADFPQ